MKNSVKLLALLLACLMTLITLTACGSTNDEGKASTSEATNGESPSGEKEESSTPTASEDNKEVETKPASVGLSFSSKGDGTCYVSVGTCTDTEIVIPSTSPEGDVVKDINYAAFSGCSNITSVYIPDSVTEIGISVFSGCSSLTYARLSPGIEEIANNLFMKCSSLARVEIPRGVKKLGNNAFLFKNST